MPADLITSIVMMVALFAVFYFFLIRPQNKKEKALKQLRDSIKVGDEIVSIGGIMGRIVIIRDDSVVIETGGDRTKIQLKKAAIQTVITE